MPRSKECRRATLTLKTLLLLFACYLLIQPPALAQVKGTRRVLISNGGSSLRLGFTAETFSSEKLHEILTFRSVRSYLFAWQSRDRSQSKADSVLIGSILPNRWPSFWQVYTRHIFAGFVALLAETFLIVSLLLERRKRKKAGAEVLRAHAQLRLAMESGKCVGWEQDLVQDAGNWFGDLRTMFGIASETFASKLGDFFKYVHPDDRSRVAEAIADAQLRHEPYADEFRVVRTDGNTRWVGSRGSFEYALNGDAKRAVGIAVDITERKQVEQALKNSEEKFSRAFRESPLAVTLTSAADYRYIEVNDTFELLTGWRSEEVLGRTSFELGTWVDPVQMRDFDERLRAEGSVRNRDIQIRRKDGAIRSVLQSCELIEINGEPCALFVTVDITDQKRIRQSLRDSESRFEKIVQSAMDAIIAIDEEMRIVLFNAAAEKMFRTPAKEALGSRMERFIPQHFVAGQQTRVPRYGETDLTNVAINGLDSLWAVRANGQEFPIEVSISQLEIGGKKLLTAIVRDITERMRAGEVQRKLAAIVQFSEDAILSVSVDGIIESWNPGAQRIYGYSEAEAVGHSIMMMVPPDFREEEIYILRRMNRGETLEQYETVRLTKEGRRIVVSLSQSPIRDSLGNIVGVSKVVRDITSQKRIEQSLRESDERFRLVANTAPVLIWISGPDKLCTYFNEPWLAFTGRSLQQELGNGWAEGVHPDDLANCWKTYESAFDQRQRFQMEYRLRRHDGEYRWISDQGVPNFDTDASFAGYIGSCTDITERKLVQEALSGLSGKLIEAHEQERTWIARELHDDVNQEIALLAVNLDRLKQDLPPLSPAATLRFEGICARVSDLGSGIQALSHRLHSSKLEYLGLAAAASSFCRELSEKHQVQIDFRTEAFPEKLDKGIGLCLFRVLQEALQNAIKHSGTQRFEVFLVGKSNSAELTVRDWGIGFDPVKAIEKPGLGLTSMNERLKLVDGDLSIDSPDGGGTLVRATAPLTISSRAAEA